MLAVKLNDLELRTTWTNEEPKQRAHSTFPFVVAQENHDTSVVYFELNPGDHLGTHTDSEEEVLFIFEGQVEVTVGNEVAVLQAPTLALVPKLVPHNLNNVGTSRAKVAGFFPARHTVSEFEKAWQPDNTHVIDTRLIAEMLTQQ